MRELSLRRSVLLATTILATATLLWPQAVGANENLREPLARIAKAVAKVLHDQSADSIAIGEFNGPPAFASSAGTGIKKILGEEFAKVGIRSRIGAKLGIQGKFLIHQESFGAGQKGPSHVRIEASLVDRNGHVLTDLNVEVNVEVGKFPDGSAITDKTSIKKGGLSIDVHGTGDDVGGVGTLAELLGGTTDLQRRKKSSDGEPPPLDRSDLVIESFTNPTAVLLNGGTAVAASRESPFTLEILVSGQPRPLTLTDGQPFVELHKGDSFQIRLTNRAAFDTAVAFLLDGVSTYAFSDIRETRGARKGQPKYTRWIIPRGQSLVLKGWHRDNESVDKFLVTDFANSAAAKLGSTNGLGTITASIRATWSPTGKPPEGEIISYGSQAPGEGIGRGERDEQSVREDRTRRIFGTTPRAVITVRYAKPADEK